MSLSRQRHKLAEAMSTVAEGVARRLREARINAGYSTASEAADAMGVNCSTYHQHENGTRPLTRKAAELYAPLLNCTAVEILHGERLHAPPQVLIVARILRGSELIPLLDKPDVATRLHVRLLNDWYARAGWRDSKVANDESGRCKRQYTDAPPGISAERAKRLGAIRIENDDMFPLVMHGDDVIYDPALPSETVVANARCVVMSDDGTAHFGLAKSITKRSVTLHAIGNVPERTLPRRELWAVIAISTAIERRILESTAD